MDKDNKDLSNNASGTNDVIGGIVFTVVAVIIMAIISHFVK